MGRWAVKNWNGQYFRGFEQYQPDYGGYYFKPRFKAIWGDVDQCAIFPSRSSAEKAMKRTAALGSQVICLPQEVDLNG